MGKVVVPATIENLDDVSAVLKEELSPDQVRRVEIPGVMVNIGATFLALPSNLIKHLGLARLQTRPAKTVTGLANFGVSRAVRLTVQGRDCDIRVTEVDDSCPVLIGDIALEMLGFAVDSKSQQLIGNSDHV
jgi:predicted aspartyl protease